ncbi:MAG TPA: thermonuclease family protein [Ramlibacter sp.]
MWRLLALPWLIAMLALPLPAAARTYRALVTSVVDGDTLWVRRAPGDAGIEIRIQGIDAPEICQRWGLQSRDALRKLLHGRRVRVDERAHDAYGRVLARLSVDGRDVGGWLVTNGLAWSPGFQHRPGVYAELQAQARDAQRGLWSQPRPLEPRAFRRQHGPCPH